MVRRDPLMETDEYKAESKKVTRVFFKYSSQERADRAASHRMGHRQREAIGEFGYLHSEIPDRCYPTRDRAVRAGLDRLAVKDETALVETMRAALTAQTEES